MGAVLGYHLLDEEWVCLLMYIELFDLARPVAPAALIALVQKCLRPRRENRSTR